MKDLVVAHLTSLTDFSGRETRGPFWRWVAILFVTSAVSYAAISLLLGIAFGPSSVAFAAVEWWSIGAIAIAAIACLAAAVTRRLHDRGLSGFWGLLPLPFLAAGLYASRPSNGETFAARMDGLLPIIVLYDVSLIVLIILLVAPSNTAENRFGAKPA